MKWQMWVCGPNGTVHFAVWDFLKITAFPYHEKTDEERAALIRGEEVHHRGLPNRLELSIRCREFHKVFHLKMHGVIGV